MDLKLVEHLLLVAESGSFSKAASILGMAQPALGRQIGKLERLCGTRLLYRHGRGVTLTPEGEQFIQRMRPMLRQIELLIGEIAQQRLQPHGPVTVVLTPTMLSLFGLLLVTSARKKYPHVKLNIVSGYSGYIQEWLIGGDLDIALLHDARRSKHIVVDYLASAGLHLVSPPDQVKRNRKNRTSIDLEELASLPLVLPTRRHGLRRTLEAACKEIGVSLNVEYEMDTLSLMKEQVVAGHAHTVLAIPAIVGELKRGAVVARKVRNPAVDTRLMLATAVNRPYTQAIRAVQAEIGEVMRQAVHASTLPLDIRFTP
ncbi:MAG: LysR family transcriptional regulator [Lautropia sp. SCN 66-9]|nr:MAG: LysR family transcriptional regulator [Lautropia sp. SCN 66-9]